MEQAFDAEAFLALEGAALAAEVDRARRRILAALLAPGRLEDCSASQLQGTLKALEEVASPILAGAGHGGSGGTGPGGHSADGGRGFYLDGMLLADGFAPLRREVLEHRHTEYLLPGGRGSTKSSFVSLMLLELMMRWPALHVLVVRQVAATLRDSVFAQMRWAVEAAGLSAEFRFVPGAVEMERRATGQRVYFRGADDVTKIKSIKPAFGAIGAVWFEELDQFAGEAAVRSMEQSALRGCFWDSEAAAAGSTEGKERAGAGATDGPGVEGTAGGTSDGPVAWDRGGGTTDGHGLPGPGGGAGWIFKSFNPPRHKSHWANRYAAVPRRGVRVFHTDYRSAGVPEAWLGAAFLQRAAALEERDAAAFAHEYLGQANLAGGMVFPNLCARRVTEEEIAAFDRVYNGADWGWYPDPWAFNRVGWLPGQRRLVIFDELRAVRKSNAETAALVLGRIGGGTPVVCDASEPKSVSDWRAAGLMAQRAEKGPGSLAYSIKWLQSLAEIVIDPARCPNTHREFEGCRYRLGPDGEPTGEIEDKNNHHIDAVRYATERIWKRRGA